MGRNLPLSTRRRLQRGISRQVIPAWANRKFMGLGNRATLTTNLAGANNDLTFIARTPGTGGNAITVALVVAGASTPLTVSATGNAITVNVATNGSSAAISTAQDVRNAINFSNLLATQPGSLVRAILAPGNDGTGVVTALAATNLTGAV